MQLFAYLLVAEAASFDKKELCRSDTVDSITYFAALQLIKLFIIRNDINDAV
jgi:hypothetical protein